MNVRHNTIYKICDKSLWAEAEKAGVFAGAEIDLTDGFIHFSTGEQTASTLEKHFAGRKDLLLIAIDAEALGDEIVFEEARGGMLFPHLYQPMQLSFVRWVKPIAQGEDGKHILPDLDAA